MCNFSYTYLSVVPYQKDKKIEFHWVHIHKQEKPFLLLTHQLHCQCSAPRGKPDLGGEASQVDLNEALDFLLNIAGAMPNILLQSRFHSLVFPCIAEE